MWRKKERKKEPEQEEYEKSFYEKQTAYAKP